MILPNVRASFGRREARALLRLLSDDDPGAERRWEERLADRGIDPLLDDPRTLELLLERQGVEVLPPRLVLYILLRHALLRSGIESRVVTDYVTALVFEFGFGDRAHRIAEHDRREYGYLVDILEELGSADGRRAFLLRVHLGNFALWLSGLFPDYIVSRVHRKGGPGLDYYDEMGETGYRMAAHDPHARRESLDGLYRTTAEMFGALRRSLNDFSDRHLFGTPSSPADRLLRRAWNDFLEADRRH